MGGAATVLLGLDRALPYSPMVHQALGAIAAEHMWGRGVPMNLSYGAIMDIACTAATGVVGGWVAERPELAGIRNAVPKLM